MCVWWGEEGDAEGSDWESHKKGLRAAILDVDAGYTCVFNL